MPKKPNPLQQNLAPEYVASAPYEGPGAWVCGWVFVSREEGERTLREVARLLASLPLRNGV